MREPAQALRTLPQVLLVQPESLGHDLSFTLALIPPTLAAIVFFQKNALLLIGLCLLGGVVCLMAMHLARITFGLPPWVGFRAHNPLVASLLIACFLPAGAPAWVGVGLVIAFVLLDSILWPQLRSVAIHPALLVFGLLYLASRELGFTTLHPFDGQTLADPLTLWFNQRLGVLDPVTLYVGNVAGPIGATSCAALLLGITYLWYARKISLALIGGFLVGVAAASIGYSYDLAFQLSSGPSLFLLGYIASDRRRLPMPEGMALGMGIGVGALTVVLRSYGQADQATWQSLLAVGLIATAVLRVREMIRNRRGTQGLHRLTVSSGSPEKGRVTKPTTRAPLPQPAMAVAQAGRQAAGAPYATSRAYSRTIQSDEDIVRQLRRTATPPPAPKPRGAGALLWIALVLFNPIGMWLIWSSASVSGRARLLASLFSVYWYLAVGALLFGFSHGLIRL